MHGRGPERLVAIALLAAIFVGTGALAFGRDLSAAQRSTRTSPERSLTIAAEGQPGGAATVTQTEDAASATTAPPPPTSAAPPAPTTTTTAPPPPTAPPTTAAPTTVPPATTVPAPTPTAPPSAPGAQTNDSWAEGVIRRELTQRRAQIGQPDLASNITLDQEARRWSREMATSVGLAHNANSLNYTYAHCANCQGASENVGRGPYASGIFSAFLDSPSHRAAIDHTGPGIVGIGSWRALNGTLYITMMFGYYS